MQWFQHDSDSTQDAKIKKLLIRHGAVGYAVYFHCLELIVSNVCETNVTFELEHDSEIIADNLRIKGTGDKSGREIVEDIMRTIVELRLFTENNGHIFCYKLIKRINLSQTSNAAFREVITAKKTEFKAIIAAQNTPVMINHDEVMTESRFSHDGIMNTNQPTNNTNQQNTENHSCVPESFEDDPTEILPIPSMPSFGKTTIDSRLKIISESWKHHSELPKYVCVLSGNMKPDTSIPIGAILQAYTDAEIMTAIDNYAQDLPNVEEKYRVQSFQNFCANSGKIAKYQETKAAQVSTEHVCPICKGKLKNGQYCKVCEKFFDENGKEMYV